MTSKGPGLWHDVWMVIRLRKLFLGLFILVSLAGPALFGESLPELLFYALPQLTGVGIAVIVLAIARRQGWRGWVD